MDISLAIPECRVARFVEQHEDHLIIPVRLDAASGRCPDCGQASRSVHSRYHREPADLPVSASQTRLRIEVRRFYCLNSACRRRTFAESPMTLLAPRARRTRRLGEAQARVGLACGGAGAARLLAHLHMPASRATVLRLVTRIPMAARSIGMTHGQILVYILLPQSLRPMVPALTNDLVTLVKNSSLLSVISVYELTRSGQAIIAARFVPFEIFLLLAIYYYVIVSALTYASRLVERRLPTW